MIVYPAIDLRGGRCVRLVQGRPDAETVFADDPAVVARRWEGEGARWLHVVNLDGALGQEGAANRHALERILAAVEIPVQFGGGLRSIEDVAAALALGAARVVLGTVAVRRPEVVARSVTEYGPERIVVGLDAREGRVAVSGWTEPSGMAAGDLGRSMAALGVARALYTDIARDGLLSGVNVEATARLARETGLRVIASGGVASPDDIRALRAREGDGIEGVVVGMALYRGAFTLAEALVAAEGEDDAGQEDHPLS